MWGGMKNPGKWRPEGHFPMAGAGPRQSLGNGRQACVSCCSLTCDHEHPSSAPPREILSWRYLFAENQRALSVPQPRGCTDEGSESPGVTGGPYLSRPKTRVKGHVISDPVYKEQSKWATAASQFHHPGVVFVVAQENECSEIQ